MASRWKFIIHKSSHFLKNSISDKANIYLETQIIKNAMYRNRNQVPLKYIWPVYWALKCHSGSLSLHSFLLLLFLTVLPNTAHTFFLTVLHFLLCTVSHLPYYSHQNSECFLYFMGRACDMHGEDKCMYVSGGETWRVPTWKPRHKQEF